MGLSWRCWKKTCSSTTFGGETLSLAAAIACIEFIRDHGVIRHLAQVGQHLSEGLKNIVSKLTLDYVSPAIPFAPC